MEEAHLQSPEETIKTQQEKMDILEQKLNETEQKLNQLKQNLDQKVIERTVEVNRLLKHITKFIDSLSHDLGTPLTPLITLLPIVKQQIQDPKMIEMIDTCIRNAEYIKRVVINARKLAEVNATDLLLRKENLNSLFQEILSKYEVVFKSCNIQIQNNISNEVFIKTDKIRLIEVFDQILSNAVNSMLDGGKLTFNSKNVQKEKGKFIQISIVDTGTGLTRDETDRIFDEFYKVDAARHKLDSTGLGLPICKAIIEKHGGKIWADSHGKGTGTTIHFTLPSPEIVYTRSF